MAYSKIETEVMEKSGGIASEYGYEIYDVELVKEGPNKFLRIFIDRADGVNIDDCEAISREVSEYLDRADLIPDNYFLEVSSPGIERVLKQDKHFNGAIGEEIRVKLFKPIEGVKEFEGILKTFDEKQIVIKLPESEAIIERKNIAKANIIFNF